MSLGNWITLAIFGAGLALAGLGAYYALQGRVAKIENRCDSHQAVIDSIAQLNSRLDKMTADNETFWRILGPHLADVIHSPKSVDRDALIDRLTHTPESMTCPDLDRVIGLLKDAIRKPEWSGEKKLVGTLLLARATQLRTDRTRECS